MTEESLSTGMAPCTNGLARAAVWGSLEQAILAMPLSVMLVVVMIVKVGDGRYNENNCLMTNKSDGRPASLAGGQLKCNPSQADHLA